MTVSNSGPTSNSVSTTDNRVAHHSLSSISDWSIPFESIRTVESVLGCFVELADEGRERGEPRDDRSNDWSQRDRSLKIERAEGVVPVASGGRVMKIVFRFVNVG